MKKVNTFALSDLNELVSHNYVTTFIKNSSYSDVNRFTRIDFYDHQL